MHDKNNQRKNYKPSPYSFDTSVIMCPIDKYALEQRLSVDEELRTSRLFLRMQCGIRFPRQLTKCLVEVIIWESEKPIVVKDIDMDHVGIGAFQLLEQGESTDQIFSDTEDVQPVLFRITVPETTENINKLSNLILQAEGKPNVHREIHVEVAGLLCEWNGKGNLSVTGLTLALSN